MTEETPMHGSEVSSGDVSSQESSPEESSHTLARRSALSLIGAGLAFLSTGSASANPGKGNGNQPWYEWNADVDANRNSLRELERLETNNLANTAYHNRSEWSTETLTLEVGTDFPTLQESVYAIPFVPYESVEINIPSGMDLSDEDVIVPQTVLGTGTVSGRGYEHKIKISGDESDPSNCPVGSLVIAGVNGGIISVDGVEFQRPNPYADDGNGVSIFYTNQARLHNCAFAGGENGVISYGSNVEIHQVDFGDNVLSGDAITTKHFGFVQEQRAGPEPPSSGTVGGHAYVATVGWIATVQQTNVPSTLTGEAGVVDYETTRSGFITAELAGGESVMQFLGSYQWAGDVHQVENGKGFVTESPDGSEYRIRVDNDGNVVTDEL